MPAAAQHVAERRSSGMPDHVPLPATLLERFARAGVDVEALVHRAEIPRAPVSAPHPPGTPAELFALWKAAEQSGCGDDLGLRVGSDALPYHLALWAALHSPTLGEAFAKVARYKRLICPEEVTIDVGGGEARLRFEWLLADCDPPALLIDAIFAGVVALAKRGTGRSVSPLRLELTRRRANEVMLRRHFGCPIRFDAPAEVLVFEEAALALPMVTQNAQQLSRLVPGLETALEQDGSARTLADDVRRTLGLRICGERPAVEKVAKALGLSSRTLQRRLGELGTSYQELLDAVRHRSARRLLANTDLAIGEVAFLLGFEELNSFTRAFSAWEGTTPTRWRAAAR